jgi:hypothetical protein
VPEVQSTQITGAANAAADEVQAVATASRINEFMAGSQG